LDGSRIWISARCLWVLLASAARWSERNDAEKEPPVSPACPWPDDTADAGGCVIGKRD
jgi:hypothetical protein